MYTHSYNQLCMYMYMYLTVLFKCSSVFKTIFKHLKREIKDKFFGFSG